MDVKMPKTKRFFLHPKRSWVSLFYCLWQQCSIPNVWMRASEAVMPRLVLVLKVYSFVRDSMYSTIMDCRGNGLSMTVLLSRHKSFWNVIWQYFSPS